MLDIPMTFMLPEDCLDKMGFLKYSHYGEPVHVTPEKLKEVVPAQYFAATRCLAMDCEMVGVGPRCDSVLARVSIVNEYGYCLYDKFVTPGQVVTDFRTAKSGIHENDLVERGQPKSLVISEVKGILENRRLVGHAVHNDLEVLDFDHPKEDTRDTADYFKSLSKQSNSLKALVKEYLKIDIQEGEHSSIQDAQATMKLYLLHREAWEKHLTSRNSQARSPDDIKTITCYPRRFDLFVNSNEVFLRKNKPIGAYHSAAEYLDIQFRLLREDFMRPLRLGVKDCRAQGNEVYRNKKKVCTPSTVRVFTNVTVRKSPRGELKGLCQIHIPVEENKLDLIQWEDSKCLINGSLIILTPDNFKSVKLGIVNRFEEDRGDTTLKQGLVNIRFIRDGPTWSTIFPTKFKMVESVGFFEAYTHTLHCLQHLDLKNFPLAKYIVHGVTTPGIIKYPAKVKDIDFSRMITSGGGANSKANINNVATWPTAANFGFNPSQYEAFQAALTQEVAIIQGPPGTGKTFLGLQLMKVFLSNPDLLSSPILVIAQTNHALDNILEPVLKFARQITGSEYKGNELMLRVGGGSKSEEISKVTLMAKNDMIKMKINVKSALGFANAGMEAAESFARRPVEISNPAVARDELSKITRFLMKTLVIYNDTEIDEATWRCHELILLSLSNFDLSSDKNKKGLRLLQVVILETLDYLRNRHFLVHQKWAQIKDLNPNFSSLVKIIGMTSTGAAKHKAKIVERYMPGIMLVEEAAHVLESHVVAALTIHCKQLILIGDHQQLRPGTADYHLTQSYGLDVSLMERLVENGKAQGNKNWVQLNVQHRMRPEIARLVCPTIYPDLQNAGTVSQYPDALGVTKNVFFLDHRYQDRREDESPSHFNEHEAEFTAKLCLYFIRQGYEGKKISIITTYMGQKNLLDRKLRKEPSCKNVRICCVDGFQGEENDIMLLSLVRSNQNNAIGFLKTDNRVCVALSRARHGLFIIGNMEGLAQSSETWKEIHETLFDMKSIGKHLSLKCKHGRITRVSLGTDFNNLSNGGCPSACQTLQKKISLITNDKVVKSILLSKIGTASKAAQQPKIGKNSKTGKASKPATPSQIVYNHGGTSKIVYTTDKPGKTFKIVSLPAKLKPGISTKIGSPPKIGGNPTKKSVNPGKPMNGFVQSNLRT